MARAPFVLLVPGGGELGAGEYARGLMLADAIRARWPDARVEFVRKRGSPRFAHDAYPHHEFADNVSRRPEEWRDLVGGLRPDAVVFDNTGRTVHLRAAHASGARVVFLSSVPQTRRRLFHWRRLRHLDQVWLVQVPPGDTRRLSARERSSARLAGGVPVRWLGSFFPAPDPKRRERLLERLGLDGRTVVFVAGGGGHRHLGQPVSEILLDAAARLASQSDAKPAVVMGPLYPGSPAAAEPLAVVGQLPPTELVDLLSGAAAVVCPASGVLCQALALGRCCVAFAAGPGDQLRRLEQLEGAIERSPLDAGELAARVRSILGDAGRVAELEARAVAVSEPSGLPGAIGALDELLG